MGSSVPILFGVLLAVALVTAEMVRNSWKNGGPSFHSMPRPYRNRASLEHIWRERVAAETMEHASTVLTIICNAFLFDPARRYRLSPDDRIAELYRSCYPSGCLRGDAREIESLLRSLEAKFGFDPSDWRPEITIHEIVQITHFSERR